MAPRSTLLVVCLISIIALTTAAGTSAAATCLKGCYTSVCVDPNKSNATNKSSCDKSLTTLTSCGEKNCKTEKNPFTCVESKCLADDNAKSFWKCAVSKCKKTTFFRTVESVMTVSDIIETYNKEDHNKRGNTEGNNQPNPNGQPQLTSSPIEYHQSAAETCGINCVKTACVSNGVADKTCLNGVKTYLTCVKNSCASDKFSTSCGASKCNGNSVQQSLLGCLHNCGGSKASKLVKLESAMESIAEFTKVHDLTNVYSQTNTTTTAAPTPTPTSTSTSSAKALSFIASMVALFVTML